MSAANPSDIIAIISLVFSFTAYIRDSRLKKRADEQQNQLERVQIELGELQLRREMETEQKRNESKVEACHFPFGTKRHRLRIANTGGVTVTDVTCEIIGDKKPYALIKDGKEPYERLEPGQSFDESLALTMSGPSKFMVVTRWTDPNGVRHSRENIVSI